MNIILIVLIIVFLVVFYVYTFLKLRKKNQKINSSDDHLIKIKEINDAEELIKIDYIERDSFNKMIQDEIHPTEEKNIPKRQLTF